MADESAPHRPDCPLCGKPAEAGCIYGPDGSWAGMRWRAGEPSIASNFFTGLGGGEQVGDFQPFCGPFVQGIRCERCRRIVLEI